MPWSQYGIPTSMPACVGIESSAFLCDRRPAPYVVNGTTAASTRGVHRKPAQHDLPHAADAGLGSTRP